MVDVAEELPVKARTAKASALLSLKRTFDLFSGNFNFGQRTAADADSQKLKLACKVAFLYCPTHASSTALTGIASALMRNAPQTCLADHEVSESPLI